MVRFYVGEITPPQTVKIYTDGKTSIPIQINEGNKWYTYVLPKDKGLYKIVGDSIKKVVVKADISFEGTNSYPFVTIIPEYTVEASFKGSNTSNVTNMDNMFIGCSGLTSLDLSGWNNSNVTDMNSMFYNCSNLTSLDLSGFNTSKVTNMRSMFSHCSNLTSLDLSKWDTSKVTNIDNMFRDCTSLKSLDLSGWDTSNVTDISNMFNGCASLTSIRMKGCSEATIKKITDVKPSGATIVTE